MKADMHVHSDVSDGSESIENIIEQAKRKGLDAIAITDHDTLSQSRKIPEKPGIRVICGAEISCEHRKSKTRVHLLAYNVQKPEIIKNLTLPILEARNRNSEKQIEILRNAGYKIEKDNLKRSDGKYLYKQHIMEWLVSTGQTDEMFGDFYQRVFKNGGVCDFDIEYADIFAAIIAVKDAGALAVLAHPGQQQNFWIIPELARLGLDGIELNHPAHSEKDHDVIRTYASRFGLFLTGGSDFHGRYDARGSNIGDYLSEESGIEALLGC